MEQIIDFDYVLRPIAEPDPSPKSSRLQLRQRRDQEFENNEQYENHRLFGPEQEGIAAPDRPDWGKLSRICSNTWRPDRKIFGSVFGWWNAWWPKTDFMDWRKVLSCFTESVRSASNT